MAMCAVSMTWCVDSAQACSECTCRTPLSADSADTHSRYLRKRIYHVVKYENETENHVIRFLYVSNLWSDKKSWTRPNE